MTNAVNPMIATNDMIKLYSNAALAEKRSQSVPNMRFATREDAPITR